VVQVSRWDRLKDPLGVLQGFLGHVAEDLGAHLVLAGPAADSVDDDPEGEAVLHEMPDEHLLQDREGGRQMGAEAYRRVCDDYLAPRHLTQELDLVQRVAG
jgi:hypothetical protein